MQGKNIQINGSADVTIKDSKVTPNESQDTLRNTPNTQQEYLEWSGSHESNQLLDLKIFPKAVLTEVAFPTLDRSANTPVSLGITIQPTQLS